MAIIERVDLNAMNHDRAPSEAETLSGMGLPGLRIGVRLTTSSLSDYPEWNIEELRHQKRNLVVTDGTCS
jgi:hypothetical protein